MTAWDPDVDDEFDLRRWRLALPACHRKFGVVVGPEDALALCSERQRLFSQFEPGPAIPVDLFLFGVGESRYRGSSKLGGLPYYDRRKPWPTDELGNPLPFLAQFNFACSHDVIKSRCPADILLIFGNLPCESIHDVKLAFRWAHPLAEEFLVQKSDVRRHAPFTPLYSNRWRTTSYVNAEAFADSQAFEIDPDDYCILRPFAAQIGMGPFMLSSLETGLLTDLIAYLPPIDPEARQDAALLNVAEISSVDLDGRTTTNEFGEVCLPTCWIKDISDATLLLFYNEAEGVVAEWLFG